jgi:hypothetical protein
MRKRTLSIFAIDSNEKMVKMAHDSFQSTNLQTGFQATRWDGWICCSRDKPTPNWDGVGYPGRGREGLRCKSGRKEVWQERHILVEDGI